MLFLRGVTATLLCASVAWAVSVHDGMVTFGHSIKNGPLPPNTELTTFEHNCSTAPCTVTQVHFPSIYPTNGEAWNWQNGRFCVYVDGEMAPSINVTLLELAWVGRWSSTGSGPSLDNKGAPWGIDKFGHTAHSGGVYSTLRVPFQRTIRTTITSANTFAAVFWFIIRGLEGLPVVLGDLELPPAAALKVYRNELVTLDSLQFIVLANVSAGNAGALLGVKFDSVGGQGVGYTYLEACMRFYPDGAVNPTFLSSGAEDYFLSASYFDENEFVTPNSGLTFYDGAGALSAYKMHDRDPVLFAKGMELVWRMGETTSGCGSTAQCPNQFCPPNSAAELEDVDSATLGVARQAAARAVRACGGISNVMAGFDRPGDDHDCFTMATNATPDDCAQACCAQAECQAWVFAVTPGAYLNCLKAGDVCCWLKVGVPDPTPSNVPRIASGFVTGHEAPPPPPPLPVPPGPSGTAQYSTLTYVYEWPAAPAARADLDARGWRAAIAVLLLMQERNLLSQRHVTSAMALLVDPVAGPRVLSLLAALHNASATAALQSAASVLLALVSKL